MGQNNDLTAILVLLGLGYLVSKSRQVSETIGAYRRSERPGIMYSPLWLPPETWRPIPGPAYRGPPLDDGEGDGEGDGEQGLPGPAGPPGIPGPAQRNGRNGIFRVPTGPRGPLVDTIRETWKASTRGLPIPGPAAQPRWPIKIGPRRVTPPMPPGLETQLRGGQYARLPPAPETSSFTGGEDRE